MERAARPLRPVIGGCRRLVEDAPAQPSLRHAAGSLLWRLGLRRIPGDEARQQIEPVVVAGRIGIVQQAGERRRSNHDGIGLPVKIPSGLPGCGGGVGKFKSRGVIPPSGEAVQFPKRSSNEP
jgi:hypothetical protein